MPTVSTFELNQLTVASALNVQSQLNQAEVQEASGLVAQDFGTMGGANSSETLNLEGEIAQAQTWSSNASVIGTKTQSMYDAIGQMSTIVSDLQSKISTALSSPDPQAIVTQAGTLLTSLVGEMNTQVAGQYVFSGGNSSIPAINMATWPSYYQGDDNPSSVRVSQQQTVNYGVLGNNTAFNQALTAMQTVINGFTQGTINSASVTGTTVESSLTTPLGLTGTFAVNGGSTVNINSTDTLNQIVSKINAAAGSTGVTASDASGQLVISAAAPATALTFTDMSGSALSALGISPTTSTATVAQSTTALDNALNLCQDAVTSLSNLQQSVATSSAQLQTLGQQQDTFVTYLKNTLSNVKDVNTGTVAAQVSQYQTQLQASYLAVASVTKLSLAQFL